MSQQQLNRLLQEREKLSREVEKSNSIIKASQACEVLHVKITSHIALPSLHMN